MSSAPGTALHAPEVHALSHQGHIKAMSDAVLFGNPSLLALDGLNLLTLCVPHGMGGLDHGDLSTSYLLYQSMNSMMEKKTGKL